MNKNLRCISVRVTEKQEQVLKKEAKARGMTLSLYLRERLFPTVDVDNFAEFKAEQTEVNAQICKLLYNLIREVKFSANVSAYFYKESRPGAENRIKKIHQLIFDQGDVENE